MTISFDIIAVSVFLGIFSLGIGIVLLLFLKVAAEKRRFGCDPIPDDIKEVMDAFGNRTISMITEDFTLDIKKGKTEVYSRRYIRPKGTWELRIEFHDGNWVAYSANYYSRYSRWINYGYEKSFYPAREIGASDIT
jgi:hypothetical protein